MPYPVSVDVQPLYANRNRLTTAFRVILAIPHIILVGGLGFSVAHRNPDTVSFGSEAGLLGAVAWVLAVVSWFTIVFTGHHILGIRQFTAFYLRWKVRALAYLMLLEDPYPPFGDAPYPASISIEDPPAPRNRLTVGFRLILVIPHAIILGLLVVVWWVTGIVAWVAILISAEYPRGLYDFGVGVLRWFMRVDAYLLLIVDEYPPFSLT